MKYYLNLSILLIILFITSCKKETTCSCYVSNTSSGSIQEITVKSNKDLSSRQKACEAESKSKSTSTQTWECSAK